MSLLTETQKKLLKCQRQVERYKTTIVIILLQNEHNTYLSCTINNHTVIIVNHSLTPSTYLLVPTFIRYEYESMQSGSATVMKQHRAGVCCCKCFPIGPPYDALATERAELDRLTQLKRTQMEKV